MGISGPKPESAALKLAKGNPGKRSLAQLFDEFKPEIEIPDVPSWLWPEAKAEWDRIGPELVKYGLVSKVDRAALALYCQTWAEFVWAKKKYTEGIRAAEKGKRAAEKEGKEWKGGDGLMMPTPNGSFTYSPYWVAANKAADQLDDFLQSFGLSPSARARVSLSDNYPYLPGMEPDGAAAPAASQPKLSLVDLAR